MCVTVTWFQRTMDGSRRSICLFLLLLSSCHTDAGHSTMQSMTTSTEDQSGSSRQPTETSLLTADHTHPPDTDANGTRADCLIDTEMGLIAIGTAGGLIVCLLLATVVLACQVCYIQRRVYAPRTSRSNMDLVSSASYWDTEQQGVGGMVGPCDASVVLEEVRAEGEREEERRSEVGEEGGPRPEEEAVVMAFDAEDTAGQIQASSSRDSCMEVPRDLEDMPLVV